MSDYIAPDLRAQVDDYIVHQLTKPNAEQLIVWLEHAGLTINDAARDAIETFVGSMRAAPDQSAATGHAEADRIVARLMSSDPDFQDCADAAALIQREIKGPDGFATWRDAAIAERSKRIASAPTVPAEVPMPEEIERLAVNRYRLVPNRLYGYKVVAGDGSRAVFEGFKSECEVIARKLTEAFLDGAHVAVEHMQQYGDAREAAGYARGLAEKGGA